MRHSYSFTLPFSIWRRTAQDPVRSNMRSILGAIVLAVFAPGARVLLRPAPKQVSRRNLSGTEANPM